jgi:L-arabinokinase
MTQSILFYVSGHGFGHSTRVEAVMNEIPNGFRLVVRTSAPGWLYRENVRRDFEFYPLECDVGLIQKDSLTIDERGTLEAWLSFEKNLPELTRQETRFIRDQRIDLVLSDIPAFPFEITSRAGIPGLALANFSWDWIYGHYVDRFPGFAPPVERLRESYSKCDLLFRLPFAGDLSAFPVH